MRSVCLSPPLLFAGTRPALSAGKQGARQTNNPPPPPPATHPAGLDTLRAGRTTVVVAHRLSTVVDADRIYVLGGGTVVEGPAPHAALLAADGPYAALVRLQAAHLQGTSSATSTTAASVAVAAGEASPSATPAPASLPPPSPAKPPPTLATAPNSLPSLPLSRLLAMGR